MVYPSVEITYFLSLIQSRTGRETKRGREDSFLQSKHCIMCLGSSLFSGTGTALGKRGLLTWKKADSLPVWSPERFTKAHRWSH